MTDQSREAGFTSTKGEKGEEGTYAGRDLRITVSHHVK